MNFEKYIEAKYPNRSPKILFQKFEDIDGTLFYGVKEIEDQAEVWNHQQTIINDLKAQLECCRKENAVLLGKVGELEKNEFLLARVKTILGCEKQTNLLESIIVRDLRKVLRGEHEAN